MPLMVLCVVRNIMASKVEIKSITELEKQHTGTLMSRRAALLKCEGAFEVTDRAGYNIKPSPSETGIIEYKDSLEWQQAYEDLKGILATRENLRSKQERKHIRQAKAKATR